MPQTPLHCLAKADQPSEKVEVSRQLEQAVRSARTADQTLKAANSLILRNSLTNKKWNKLFIPLKRAQRRQPLHPLTLHSDVQAP